MLKQQNNIVWSLISLNNAHAMSWKVHCFIQQYLLFALNEALCQFLSKFDIYPISIWRNFFQFEFVRNFVYSIFYYLTSTGLYEQNFLCYRSHIGSSLKVPGLTHCELRRLLVGVYDISMTNYRKPINRYFWNYRQLIDIEKSKFWNYRKIIDIGKGIKF